jgi:two-component system, NarL family, sensor histidine kinase DesK
MTFVIAGLMTPPSTRRPVRRATLEEMTPIHAVPPMCERVVPALVPVLVGIRVTPERYRGTVHVPSRSDDEELGTLGRVAEPAAVAYAAVWAVLQIALVAETPGTTGDVIVAAGATLAYLPAYLWNIRCAARGEQTLGWWSVLMIAGCVALPTAKVGALWLLSYHVIAVTTVVVLPRVWSWLAFAAVVVAQVPLALVLQNPIPSAPLYFAITVVWRSATILVPLWLVNTTRELRASRFRLAEQATLQERIRIDDDLRRSIQPALGAIVARGDRAKTLVGEPEATGELRELADSSRATLADARQLIRGYQRASLADELRAAVAILEAAGIGTRVTGASDTELDAAASAELRAGLATVLRAPGLSTCLITVSHVGDHVRISVDGQPSRASGRMAKS